MESLLKITDFDDLNQIDFAVNSMVTKYVDVIVQNDAPKHVIDDAKRQLLKFRSLQSKTGKAVNDYLKN